MTYLHARSDFRNSLDAGRPLTPADGLVTAITL